MIGAADGATHIRGRGHKDHAPMAAGVLEYGQCTIVIAHDQQGHPKKIDRLCITRIGNILGKTNA